MQWTFQPYSPRSKTTCPSCNKRKEFTRLINAETGELLPPNYGVCNRFKKCGYRKFPNGEKIETTGEKIALKEKKNYLSIIKQEVLNNTLINKYEDNFSKWLIKTFGEESKKTLDKYKIGNLNGQTVFWQIDVKERIRSGKIIKYDINTGKRGDYINWMHSYLKIKDFSLHQVLFGANLIKMYPELSIVITEGEKNSIVADVIYGEKFLFLSCGQLYGLNEEKLKVLEGRNVIFYPDKGRAHKLWKNKLDKLKLPFHYRVSDVLEYREDLEDGSDLADLILKDKTVCNKF